MANLVTRVIYALSSAWILCVSASLSCLHNADGRHYMGDFNMTISGQPCLPWSFVKDKYSLRNLNIKQYSENSCRNPNGSESTWCYVSQDKIEKCLIPMCPANPKANFCIVIPIIHFTICPSLFSRRSLFQDYGMSQVAFCCAWNITDIESLLPRNACFVVIVSVDTMSQPYASCPEGFHTRPLTDDTLESNVIYKCCKSKEPSPGSSTRLKDYVATIGANPMAPIIAYIVLNGTQCPPFAQLNIEMEEYHEMDRLSKYVLPPKVIVCYYFSKNRSSGKYAYDQLGFMTAMQCPDGFKESGIGGITVIGDSVTMRHCWPKKHPFVHFKGSVCLNVRRHRDSALTCPDDLQVYDIRSGLVAEPFARFCCKHYPIQYPVSIESITMTKNTSLSFITPTGICPSFDTAVSTKVFPHSALIDLGSTYAHQSNSSAGPNVNTLVVSVCTYEIKQEIFAYKKIGPDCPMGMDVGNITFSITTSTNESLLIEYCVGDATNINQTFPIGRYCLYKVGRQCPLGFQPKKRDRGRHILSRKYGTSNYDQDALCCRADTTDEAASHLFFPFIKSNVTISFGLLLPTSYEICPNISSFISYLDFDSDEPYCAYRSREKYFLWSNEIVWPQAESSNRDNEAIINTNPKPLWNRLSIGSYRPSVIYRYPKGEYCFLSTNKCLVIKGVSQIVPYPINNLLICCVLNLESATNDYLLSYNKRIVRKHLIGYVALHHKCPLVDGNVLVLKNVINDTFEIEDKNFNSSYVFSLMKLGIHVDMTSKDKFVRITFIFCIFEFIERRIYEDQPSIWNLPMFIKPMNHYCVDGFHEIIKKIVINVDEEFDPLAHYFIANNSLSICLPRIENQNKTQWPKPLCEISLTNCSSDLHMTINGSTHDEPLHVCCPIPSTKTTNTSSLINLSQFSLPVHPQHQNCPIIDNHSSLLWQIYLPGSDQLRHMSLCYYYESVAPVEWPPGKFLTVAYKRQCPTRFTFIDYNVTGLCARRNTGASAAKFPHGKYCVLTFVQDPCPPGVAWHSSVDLIGGTLFNVCCSTSTDVVINVHSKESTFALLSLDKCSIVPGTEVKQIQFLYFTKIIQCVYTRIDCGKHCSQKYDIVRDKMNIKVSMMTTQYIIISLLVSLLLLITLFGVAFIIHGRQKLSLARNSMVYNTRLSAIYTMIDSSVNIENREDNDEDIQSVTYSTVA